MSGPEILDRYLLGEPVSKPAVIGTVLRDRSPLPAAAPFYRACATGDRAGLRKLLARDAEVLAVLPHPGDEPDLEGLGLAARDAYRRELES